jgi:DNA ligase (NAD+)
MAEDILKKIQKLREVINRHDYLYNVKDAPEITDAEYDRLYYELDKLEKEYPQYHDVNSPTQRIGAKLLEGFSKVEHQVQMQSLQDVFGEDELSDFLIKTEKSSGKKIEYIIERKIDGLSVSLEYQNGEFLRGSTRGNGFVGEDITANLRTIKTIPMVLTEKIPYIEVRGEVFIGKSDFKALNEEQDENSEQVFANPRNAAAGSVRQLAPNIAAKRKLDIFIFNIQRIEGKSFNTHSETLEFLDKLGFKVDTGYFVTDNPDEVLKRIREIGEERNDLEFDIDGAVIKVNSLADREVLGVTSKNPKWAVAFKYPAERKKTIIRDINVKVGRTGVLTPNAEFDTIRLAGTNVSRATLHNMDYIDSRNIKIGSEVWVQKAGDIIPEVIEVVSGSEKGDEKVFKMPENCPVCGSDVIREDDKAAYTCTGIECPAKIYRSIVHFVSRDAMDIEGMGESIVKLFLEKNLIKTIADIYVLKDKRDELINLDRMGEKSVDNLLKAIEKSKTRGLERLIYGMGIKHIGLGGAKELVRNYPDMDEIINLDKEKLVEIPEFGEKMAISIVVFFSQKQNIHTINLLKEYGLNMKSGISKIEDTRFQGMTFVLTGTLDVYPRAKAKEIIESYGGKVSGSVSKKTDYVLVGKDPGSKFDKAKTLGIKIINEDDFESLISE